MRDDEPVTQQQLLELYEIVAQVQRDLNAFAAQLTVLIDLYSNHLEKMYHIKKVKEVKE